MEPEEGVKKGNETEAKRKEAESEGKRGYVQEKEEVDMGEELKKGEEDAMVEDEERVDEGEVNKGGESPVKALNEVDMKEDT